MDKERDGNGELSEGVKKRAVELAYGKSNRVFIFDHNKEKPITAHEVAELLSMLDIWVGPSLSVL